KLEEMLSRQPAWSDLPIIVFTFGAAAVGRATDPGPRLGERWNATLLDRPVRKIALLTAVRAGLRARRRQYEVRDLLRESQKSVEQRDHFLAMLGHELRNPLAAIVTAVELVERSSGSNPNPQHAVIQRQTRVLSRLVDDLLDVARVTSGKIGLLRVPVDLSEVVGRCVQSLAASADCQSIDLLMVPSRERILLEGDTTRLEQLFTNLLTNAIKYTPAGGRVDVTVTAEDEIGCVRVRDTGVGIAPEALPTIFDLFTQAPRTLDRSQGGLGIGLTLVRNLASLHGGSVEAKSEGLGRGSEFLVKLPRTGSRDVPERRTRSRVEVPAGALPRRILIVEDNADLREGLTELLRGLNHEVWAAEEGLEGLRRAIELQPEVVVLDIGLPGMDGYALARRIREALGSRTLLVALTGYGQPEDRRRALNSGFDVHLTKPVRSQAIVDLLQTRERASARN
ncbi:MAG: response regulator, partial [Acidobacteria bacterium]|nr:response regulator [Acidobacteriota bacterium]